MNSLKTVTLILLAFLYVQLSAQNVEETIIEEDGGKVTIIKKTVDKDGKETIKKIVTEAGDERKMIFIDDEGNVKDIDIDIDDVQSISVEKTIEVESEDKDGIKTVHIQMKDGAAEDFEFKWKGEGDMPDEVVKELSEKGIKIKMDGDNIMVVSDGGAYNYKSSKGDKKPKLGVVFGQKKEVKNIDGVETVTESAPMELMDVIEGSPAANAGLQAGDIIKTVNDKPVDKFDDLVDMLNEMKSGDTLSIGYERDGELKQTTATLK